MRLHLIAALALAATPAAAARPAEVGAAFVQGRFALADQRLGDAARAFDRALAADPTDPALARGAFELAVTAGDRKAALRLADGLAASQPDNNIAAVARVIGAMGDARRYDAAVAGIGDAARQIGMQPILTAWGRVARRDYAGALAALDAPATRGIAASYLNEHRAHVLAAAGRWQESADLLAGLAAASPDVARLRIAGAAAYLHAGRRDAAITLLGGGRENDPLLAAARARLLSGGLFAARALDERALGGPTVRPADGIATLLSRVAADLARDRPTPAALAFARLATFASPDLPELRLQTAELLARVDQTTAAAELLATPAPAPFNRLFAWRRAAILAGGDRFADARAALAPLLSSAAADDWLALATVERAAENFPAAADAVGRARALAPADPRMAEWWFLEGAAREQAGDWARAEPALRAALKLAPDNPTVLNYLGYALLDRRQNVDEADALIAAALKGAPDNGAIIDSAGWAALKRGRVAEAVQLLERAAAAEPADAAIADHLGDAYWAAGRRMEARFAWNQARALGAAPELAARIAAKLDYGPEVAARVAAR